jgi:hypothetical protein
MLTLLLTQSPEIKSGRTRVLTSTARKSVHLAPPIIKLRFNVYFETLKQPLIRNMSEVDRRITDPHFGAPFLEWYDGIFDSVYIALHSFVTIEGMDPGKAERLVMVVNRNDIPAETLTLDLMHQIAEQRKEGLSFDLETVQTREKEIGSRVSWEHIKESCGFSSIPDVNRALLAIIMAINEKHRNAADTAHLEAFCDANQIFLPTEDVFPPIMQPEIASLLQRLNSGPVYIADEINQNIAKLDPAAMFEAKPWMRSGLFNFRANKIYPEDYSFLLIVPWDNFYTAICGDGNRLKAAKIEELFEGFWCDSTTTGDW